MTSPPFASERVADRAIGQYRAVLIGGIVIACGHFSMAFPSTSFFFLGLGLTVIGTGLLKPNVSSMVGTLYAQDDPRRDSGFSIFYMGINVGAMFAATFVAGVVLALLARPISRLTREQRT